MNKYNDPPIPKYIEDYASKNILDVIKYIVDKSDTKKNNLQIKYNEDLNIYEFNDDSFNVPIRGTIAILENKYEVHIMWYEKYERFIMIHIYK